MRGKRISLNIVCAFVGLWLAVFIIYRVTLMWNGGAAEHKTEAFLDAVQQRGYERAAKLYGGTIEAEVWTADMRKLHEEKGFKLLSYDNVKAEFDDGCYCSGHADLTIEVDGRPLEVVAILTFANGAKPGQICVITPSGQKAGSIPEIEGWNRLACGGSF